MSNIAFILNIKGKISIRVKNNYKKNTISLDKTITMLQV